nr:hypothetical protein [Klebsiella quasipneumoniae]
MMVLKGRKNRQRRKLDEYTKHQPQNCRSGIFQKIGGNPAPYTILIAEREKIQRKSGMSGIQQPDGAEKYRKNSPEKMRFNYSYALCRGMNKQFRYINVAEADHFKQFLRQIACSGVDIRDIY